MGTARNPDGSRIFRRGNWLTKSQVQEFLSRLAATRRRRENQDIQIEDVLAGVRAGKTRSAGERSRPAKS